MSKGYAIFIRVFGSVLAGMEIIAAILTWEDGPLAVILYLVSAIVVLILALQYANHIDTTVRHEQAIAELTRAVKSLKAPPREEPSQVSDLKTAGASPSADVGEFLNKVRSELRPAAGEKVRPVPVPDDPGYFVCPCCGKMQKGSRSDCWNCGVPFLTD